MAEPAPAASQEAGATTDGVPQEVVEADIVKAVGSRIYLLDLDDGVGSDTGRFSSFEISPSGEIRPVSTLDISGQAREFLVAGETVVLVRDVFESGSRGLGIDLIEIGPDGQLAFRETLFVEGGSYVTSRLVGTTAHLVVRSSYNGWEDDFSKGHLYPGYALRAPEGREPLEGRLGRCRTTFLPERQDPDRAPIYGKVLSVISIPLDVESLRVRLATFIGAGLNEIVMVNDHALYIGSEGYGDESKIMKFDLDSKAGRAVYAAKGTVPGRLSTAFVSGGYNDQFSMDEYQGYLRVATTQGALWGGSAESSLYVLAEEGRRLKIVGELRDLHRGEAVYAVRFIGERGYVVTFKKIDPLFVVDLSDPTHPVLKGELKVPGFSTYLRPIDDGTLLAIGKDADDQGTFAWFGGVKLSLFDVSDMDHPREIAHVVIGERGTESEALRDSRAFNYFADRGLLAIPVDLVSEEPSDDFGWRSAGRLDHHEEQFWTVDKENGFTPAGVIRHDDLSPVRCVRAPCDVSVPMRRALEVGDWLVTLSGAGLTVHAFGSYDVPISSLSLLNLEEVPNSTIEETLPMPPFPMD